MDNLCMHCLEGFDDAAGLWHVDICPKCKAAGHATAGKCLVCDRWFFDKMAEIKTAVDARRAAMDPRDVLIFDVSHFLCEMFETYLPEHLRPGLADLRKRTIDYVEAYKREHGWR